MRRIILLLLLISLPGCSNPKERIVKGKWVFTSPERKEGADIISGAYFMRDGAYLMRDGKIKSLGKNLGAPVWSNNGKYIATFLDRIEQGKEEIIIFDEYGNKVETIPMPKEVWNLSWSPDDKKIAYTVSEGRISKYIFTYDLEKNTHEKIYEGDDKDWITDLSYSPQGDRFVFRNLVYKDENKLGVYVINGDGTGLKKVSKYGSDPSWFPDGKHLLIVTSRKDNGSYYYTTHKASYFKISADTGEVVEELMHEPVAVGAGTKLSRNGKYIYTAKVIYQLKGIVVIPLEGKYKHQDIPIYPPNKVAYDLWPDWYQG